MENIVWHLTRERGDHVTFLANEVELIAVNSTSTKINLFKVEGCLNSIWRSHECKMEKKMWFGVKITAAENKGRFHCENPNKLTRFSPTGCNLDTFCSSHSFYWRSHLGDVMAIIGSVCIMDAIKFLIIAASLWNFLFHFHFSHEQIKIMNLCLCPTLFFLVL